MSRRIPITAYDLMDSLEVSEAFGVSQSTLQVALSRPQVIPSVSAFLPAPIRKIGKSHCWLRADVEAGVKAKEKATA